MELRLTFLFTNTLCPNQIQIPLLPSVTHSIGSNYAVLVIPVRPHFYLHYLGGNMWHLSLYVWLILLYRRAILYYVRKPHIIPPVCALWLQILAIVNNTPKNMGI